MPLFLQVPVNKVKRVGDPICDVFGVQVFANRTLVALADGCNWGEKPKKGESRESRCLSIDRLVEGHALCPIHPLTPTRFTQQLLKRRVRPSWNT